MRALKAFLSIAVACYVAYPWEWLAAEEEIKYLSPDGRFALRSVDEQKVELIEDMEKIKALLTNKPETRSIMQKEQLITGASLMGYP